MSKLKTIGDICSLIILLMFGLGCNISNKEASEDTTFAPYFSERKRMVEHQIKGRGIDDKKIIDVFLKVERHRFVPEKYIPNAYEDRPLAIGQVRRYLNHILLPI